MPEADSKIKHPDSFKNKKLPIKPSETNSKRPSKSYSPWIVKEKPNLKKLQSKDFMRLQDGKVWSPL